MMKNAFCLFLLALFVVQPSHAADATAGPRWWKGNLHTHSLWSDGDDFPEMIASWYKEQGYQFLALSDHNTLLDGPRWIHSVTNRGGTKALQRYIERYGTNWVELRHDGTNSQVRLKPLSEFRALLEEPSKFLMIPAEEITDRHGLAPVHMNVTNPREFIKPAGGNSVLEVMQNNVNAVLKQRKETGQPMFPHLNHPNFGWGVTAEDLMRVQGEKFFEVYNGHPQVNNDGDARRPSTDRMWDMILAYRLTQAEPEIMYGIGVDDSHHYFKEGPTMSNSGRGWVMVQANFLTPENIVHAMEAGNFYASSGVRLNKVQRVGKTLAVDIDGDSGVKYRTQFIGTHKAGVHADNQADAAGRGVGVVLGEMEGLNARYEFKGNELYVRAKIISSKLKANGVGTNEVECAWVQPHLP